MSEYGHDISLVFDEDIAEVIVWSRKKRAEWNYREGKKMAGWFVVVSSHLSTLLCRAFSFFSSCFCVSVMSSRGSRRSCRREKYI